MNSKNIVIAVLALVLVGATTYLLLNKSSDLVVNNEEVAVTTDDVVVTEETDAVTPPVAEVTKKVRGSESVLGTSNDGTAIKAYHFGTGDTELLFVGGAHGGYSWNTALVGYELIDHLAANPKSIPENITVTVIPVLNPDGLELAVGTSGKFDIQKALAVSQTTRTEGRFNSNDVDINRNFDCNWSKTGTWKSQQVSGGSAPFSEPEAIALRDYVNTFKPAAAVVWFSSEGKVYPSACEGAPSKDSVELTATFATAAGYGAAAEFNAYDITGDMVNWMAKQGVPAISVLLTDYKSTEWSKNKAGVEAVIKAYSLR